MAPHERLANTLEVALLNCHKNWEAVEEGLSHLDDYPWIFVLIEPPLERKITLDPSLKKYSVELIHVTSP